MKYIITENQLSELINNLSVLTNEQLLLGPALSLKLSSLTRKPAEFYEKWVDFSDSIRPRIEKVAKELYNTSTIKDRNSAEYRKLKDQEDAFCHQLASAISTNLFGSGIADVIGKLNELKGGLRIFLKGNPGRNIEKYTTFSSGYTEDVANNNLGINIGKKFPNQTFEFYQKKVAENINLGNYYDSNGNKVKQS